MLTATWTAVEVAKPVGALGIAVEREALVDVTVRMSVLVEGSGESEAGVDVTVKIGPLGVELELRVGKRPGGGPVYATGTETEVDVEVAKM